MLKVSDLPPPYLCSICVVCQCIDAISKAEHVTSGDVSCESQYHFTMETQVRDTGVL